MSRNLIKTKTKLINNYFKKLRKKFLYYENAKKKWKYLHKKKLECPKSAKMVSKKKKIRMLKIIEKLEQYRKIVSVKK